MAIVNSGWLVVSILKEMMLSIAVGAIERMTLSYLVLDVWLIVGCVELSAMGTLG